MHFKKCNFCHKVKPLEQFYGRRTKCRECRNAYLRARYANPDVKAYSTKAAMKAWRAKPEAKALMKASGTRASRRRATPEGLVAHACAARIAAAKTQLGFTWGPLDQDLPRGKQGGRDSTFNLLGIVSWTLYVKYLKDRFYDGMNWEGYGRGDDAGRRWYISFMRPLWTFDLDDPAQRIMAFHHTNTEPAFDDCRKMMSKWDVDVYPLKWNGLNHGGWVQKKRLGARSYGF